MAAQSTNGSNSLESRNRKMTWRYHNEERLRMAREAELVELRKRLGLEELRTIFNTIQLQKAQERVTDGNELEALLAHRIVDLYGEMWRIDELIAYYAQFYDEFIPMYGSSLYHRLRWLMGAIDIHEQRTHDEIAGLKLDVSVLKAELMQAEAERDELYRRTLGQRIARAKATAKNALSDAGKWIAGQTENLITSRFAVFIVLIWTLFAMNWKRSLVVAAAVAGALTISFWAGVLVATYLGWQAIVAVAILFVLGLVRTELIWLSNRTGNMIWAEVADLPFTVFWMIFTEQFLLFVLVTLLVALIWYFLGVMGIVVIVLAYVAYIILFVAAMLISDAIRESWDFGRLSGLRCSWEFGWIYDHVRTPYRNWSKNGLHVRIARGFRKINWAPLFKGCGLGALIAVLVLLLFVWFTTSSQPTKYVERPFRLQPVPERAHRDNSDSTAPTNGSTSHSAPTTLPVISSTPTIPSEEKSLTDYDVTAMPRNIPITLKGKSISWSDSSGNHTATWISDTSVVVANTEKTSCDWASTGTDSSKPLWLFSITRGPNGVLGLVLVDKQGCAKQLRIVH